MKLGSGKNLEEKKSDIEKVILSNFPKTKIEFIKEFPEGYNNIAYDVKTSDGNFVVKILKLKGLEENVLKQNKVRTLVRKKFKDFPIPQIIKSDFSKRVIDKPFIIAEKIEGKSVLGVQDLIKNKEELFEEIGELYGKLHSFKMDSFGELDSELNLKHSFNDWYQKICEKTDKAFRVIEENKLLSEKTLELNKNFFKENKLILKKEIGPRLCHGDASLSNILVKKIKSKFVVNGMIDFEFCRASGTTQELFSGLRKPDLKLRYKRSLIKGYSKYNRLPKEWESLVYFYKWLGYLERLTKIKTMTWRDLNKEETEKRKKDLRKEALANLRIMRKKFISINKNH